MPPGAEGDRLICRQRTMCAAACWLPDRADGPVHHFPEPFHEIGVGKATASDETSGIFEAVPPGLAIAAVNLSSSLRGGRKRWRPFHGYPTAVRLEASLLPSGGLEAAEGVGEMHRSAVVARTHAPGRRSMIPNRHLQFHSG